MKIVIKSGIFCDYANLKKYLSAQYISLVSKCYYGEIVNLVCFPADDTITSSKVIKAQKKITNTEVQTLYFARCFTMEAVEVISESNGTAFYLKDFPWTDESYNNVRNNIYL